MAQVAAAAVGAVLLVDLKTADMEELGVPIPPVLGVRREQVMLMLAQAELIIYLDVETAEVAAVGVAQVGQAESPVGEEEAEAMTKQEELEAALGQVAQVVVEKYEYGCIK